MYERTTSNKYWFFCLHLTKKKTSNFQEARCTHLLLKTVQRLSDHIMKTCNLFRKSKSQFFINCFIAKTQIPRILGLLCVCVSLCSRIIYKQHVLEWKQNSKWVIIPPFNMWRPLIVFSIHKGGDVNNRWHNAINVLNSSEKQM